MTRAQMTMTPDTLQLAWAAPATEWEEAIPIGDGHLGAMVFGGALARYQINDATVWSGTPDGPAEELERVRAAGAGPARLKSVREALANANLDGIDLDGIDLDGADLDRADLDRAEELLMAFEGRYSQEFLPFVDLFVELQAAVTLTGEPARVLDLDSEIVEELLRVGQVTVHRRSQVAAHTLIVEITADGSIPELRIRLATPLREQSRSASPGRIDADIALPIDGAPLHEPTVQPALRYSDDGPYDAYAAATVRTLSDGLSEVDGDELVFRDSGRIVISVSSATRAELWLGDPLGSWRTASRESIGELASARAAAGLDRGIVDRRSERSNAHQPAHFAIGGRREGRWDVDADILHGSDAGLRATVIAEYGRYLLSSASRTGGPAANLSGIWNADIRPAWSSNYTININTQMNYWATGPLGLDEQLDPLITLVERIAATGSSVARDLYGARGWVAHHNSDLWGWSLPVGMGHGAPSWAIWMMGGVWLCNSLWDSVDFTGDDTLLSERIWPLMRGAAEFCLDWMIVDSRGTHLAPSTSPENLYTAPDGRPRALGLTATMDIELIVSLFRRSITAIDRVDPTSPLRQELVGALAVLPELSVGADGRLREWSEDVSDYEPGHRHLSALAALYPLDLISLDSTPELAEGARQFLDDRGPGAMGWSWAWKIALRARLAQGDIAHDLLVEALTPYSGDVHRNGPVDGSEWGGLLPNLFSTHPPFQIDGNLGFPAAIAELLLQSHGDLIELLPALPSAWPDGRVDRLRARSGISVDLAWSAGRLDRAVFRDLLGFTRTLRVRYAEQSADVILPAGGETRFPFHQSTTQPLAPMTASGKPE